MDQEALKGVTEQTSSDDECRRSGADGVGVCLDEEGLSSQSIGSRTIDREAIENLRAFLTILQEWDEEDRREAERVSRLRQERAAKTIADHFAEGVESG